MTGLPEILRNMHKHATIIHIEIDEAEINKNVIVDVEINNDAKDALKLPYSHWLKRIHLKNG